MELLVILGVIFAIINAFSKKKQQEAQEARRRAAQAQQAQMQMRQEATPGDPRFPPLQPQINPPPMYTPQSDPRFPQESTQRETRYQEYTPPPQAADPRFPQLSAQEIAAAQARRRAEQEAQRKRQQAAPPKAFAEGETTPGMGGARMTSAPGATVNTRMEATKGRRHTLEASSATGHSHTESSMTGAQENCPPEAVRTAAIVPVHAAPSIPAALARLSSDHNAVLQGILYSEILGKPKAMRRA